MMRREFPMPPARHPGVITAQTRRELAGHQHSPLLGSAWVWRVISPPLILAKHPSAFAALGAFAIAGLTMHVFGPRVCMRLRPDFADGI
jgi:hypothetical protein